MELLPFVGIPVAIALVAFGVLVARGRRRRRLPPLTDLDWDEPVAGQRGCGPDVSD